MEQKSSTHHSPTKDEKNPIKLNLKSHTIVKSPDIAKMQHFLGNDSIKMANQVLDLKTPRTEDLIRQILTKQSDQKEITSKRFNDTKNIFNFDVISTPKATPVKFSMDPYLKLESKSDQKPAILNPQRVEWERSPIEKKKLNIIQSNKLRLPQKSGGIKKRLPSLGLASTLEQNKNSIRPLIINTQNNGAYTTRIRKTPEVYELGLMSSYELQDQNFKDGTQTERSALKPTIHHLKAKSMSVKHATSQQPIFRSSTNNNEALTDREQYERLMRKSSTPETPIEFQQGIIETIDTFDQQNITNHLALPQVSSPKRRVPSLKIHIQRERDSKRKRELTKSASKFPTPDHLLELTPKSQDSKQLNDDENELTKKMLLPQRLYQAKGKAYKIPKFTKNQQLIQRPDTRQIFTPKQRRQISTPVSIKFKTAENLQANNIAAANENNTPKSEQNQSNASNSKKLQFTPKKIPIQLKLNFDKQTSKQTYGSESTLDSSFQQLKSCLRGNNQQQQQNQIENSNQNKEVENEVIKEAQFDRLLVPIQNEDEINHFKLTSAQDSNNSINQQVLQSLTIQIPSQKKIISKINDKETLKNNMNFMIEEVDKESSTIRPENQGILESEQSNLDKQHFNFKPKIAKLKSPKSKRIDIPVCLSPIKIPETSEVHNMNNNIASSIQNENGRESDRSLHSMLQIQSETSSPLHKQSSSIDSKRNFSKFQRKLSNLKAESDSNIPKSPSIARSTIKKLSLVSKGVKAFDLVSYLTRKQDAKQPLQVLALARLKKILWAMIYPTLLHRALAQRVLNTIPEKREKLRSSSEWALNVR